MVKTITIESMMPEDFIGGTIVEYKMYCGYRAEHGRAKITDVIWSSSGGSLHVEFVTNSDYCFFAGTCVNIKKVEKDIWYFNTEPYFKVCYAVAPTDILIPKADRDAHY